MLGSARIKSDGALFDIKANMGHAAARAGFLALGFIGNVPLTLEESPAFDEASDGDIEGALSSPMQALR